MLLASKPPKKTQLYAPSISPTAFGVPSRPSLHSDAIIDAIDPGFPPVHNEAASAPVAGVASAPRGAGSTAIRGRCSAVVDQ